MATFIEQAKVYKLFDFIGTILELESNTLFTFQFFFGQSRKIIFVACWIVAHKKTRPRVLHSSPRLKRSTYSLMLIEVCQRVVAAGTIEVQQLFCCVNSYHTLWNTLKSFYLIIWQRKFLDRHRCQFATYLMLYFFRNE